ncbi:MAG: IgGFc-binding protein [Deltaproteobacteria bacterium]|nr:IgGFc-binding protein [Deltaproteobacteria bacterium]
MLPKTVIIAPQQPMLRVHALRLMLAACSLLALALGSARPALAQVSTAVDNKGTEFFMAFLPQLSGAAHEVELHLTADVATDVTVQYPAGAPTFETTVAVQPGSIEIVSLPDQASDPGAGQWTSDSVTSNLVRAFSEREFVAYMINLYQYSSDAALALPVDALNTDYIVASKYVSLSDEFAVFAPFDDTTVTITPTAAFGSRAAGVPFDVVLNRGEAYFAQVSGEFSGTLISASRPVGLTNGNVCTQIPGAGGSGACDHIFEVAQPVQTWGNEVPVTNLPRRTAGSGAEPGPVPRGLERDVGGGDGPDGQPRLLVGATHLRRAVHDRHTR